MASVFSASAGGGLGGADWILTWWTERAQAPNPQSPVAHSSAILEINRVTAKSKQDFINKVKKINLVNLVKKIKSKLKLLTSTDS